MDYFRKTYFLVLFLFSTNAAFGWGNHVVFTNICVDAIQSNSLDNLKYDYVPIDEALKSIGIQSKAEFAHIYQIQENKIQVQKINLTNWKEIIAFASSEPDMGMDQELNVSSDQDMMGGYHGLSSQGFRHMFYRKYDILSPLETLHVPPRKMGQAPERAKLFFELSQKFYNQKQYYWAIRTLGWGLHYVQDLSQPYHVSQFASFQLLAFSKLFQSFSALVKETTRLVSNYHLSFEELVDVNLSKNQIWQKAAVGAINFEEFNKLFNLNHLLF